ncbi:PKD domain-containing protein [uncultured Cytophaga sp.]|uniref:PKD domain-containing protein n=1 Tax=uncultured Cytophaga sp. TaxID=160238 RepID=UPI00260E34A5|nr:PKD domain-containing protein [uncultured Cytophaga sp.]
MTKYFKIIFLYLLFISGVAYGQSADILIGCVPLTVTFTSPATATTYFWDFKDGVTSDHQNPSNLFNKPGIYNVTFQESVNGPVIKTIKIEVLKKAEINILQVDAGCFPLNSLIKSNITTDPKVTINKYTWVYGDGTSEQGPNLATVPHLYTQKGLFSISVGIETNYPTCDRGGLFKDVVQVYDAPVASFTTTPAIAVTCNSTLNVGFNNTSTGTLPLSYLWDLGNGKTSTLATPSNQVYTVGSYIPKLSVKFAANLTGCQSTASSSASVGRPIPIIKKSKDTICIYDSARFITSSIGNKLWTVDANSIIRGYKNRDTVYVIFSKAGKHTVTLQVTTPDGLCSDKTTALVYVDEVTVSILHTPQNSCSSPLTVQYKAELNQSNVNYLWTFNDGSLSTAATPSKTYKSATNQTYYGINVHESQVTALIVTSKKTGCKANTSTNDTLWLPNGRIMPDVSRGCLPLSVTFRDVSTSFDPIVKWKWLLGDGTIKNNTNNNSETVIFNQVGTYDNRIIVTTKKGCIDTSYAITIEVGDKITGLDFVSSKTEVCPGEPVTFNTVLPTNLGNSAGVIESYHFTTEGNRSFHCNNEDQLTWKYTDLYGPQDVSLTVETNGCLTTIKKPAFINVKGTIAKIDYSAACNNPYTYHFKDVNTNATSLTWDFGDATVGSTINETKTYTTSGDYRVILTATETSSGCPSTKDTVIIKARKLKADINSDSLFCLNGKYTFNANKSVDVFAECRKGYDWKIPNSEIREVKSSSPIAEFEFKKAGVFTAQLIVTDVNGCTDTVSRKIKVFDIKPAITADDVFICNPSKVTFTDLSIGDTTLTAWNWNFGDGTSSPLQNPTHTFTTPPQSNSEYNIFLTVQDKIGCRDTISMIIKQYQPTSTIIAKSGICVGEPLSLSATDYTIGGSSLKYNWDFGNSTTSTQQSNNIVLYTTDQVYNVVLNYEEISTGCKGQTSKQISVQTYPTAVFTTNVDTVKFLCAPRGITFTDKSTSKYPITNSWNFGNGEVSTQPNYVLAYGKGNYLVQHIVTTSNGCADTTSRNFKIYGPEGNFVADKHAICKGEFIHFEIKDTIDVVFYTWAFGDGIVVDNIAPVDHQYNFHPPSGATIAKLSLTSSQGCDVQIQIPIQIYQVIADFNRLDGVDTTTCFNDGPYALTNKSMGADLSNWDFGDGKTSTQANLSNHAYSEPGTYNVTLAIKSQSLGCVDTIAKKIIIYKNPETKAIGDTVCQGQGTVALNVLNPDPTSTYKWAPPIGLSSTTSTNPIATIQHSVQYQVIETDKNGCTDKTTVPAIIIESIGLRGLDTSIVIGDIITLPVNGQSYYKYTWTPPTGLSCLTCNNPTVQPLDDIKYNLNVTDVRGCYDQNYQYNIKIKPETFIKMPTMFTPNGDGNNDVVFVNGWGVKTLLEYQIFNRWGQLIFTTSNMHEGWDGTFNGALQSSDIYVYKVKALTWKNIEIKEEGYINLVR